MTSSEKSPSGKVEQSSPTAKSLSQLKGRALVRLLLAVIGGMLLLRYFVIAAYSVPTPSMEPSIYAGDYVLVCKLRFTLNDFVQKVRSLIGSNNYSAKNSFLDLRNSVVAFRFKSPTDTRQEETILVKRVVACAGDTIAIDGHQIVYKAANPDFFDLHSWSHQEYPYSGVLIIPAKNQHIELSAESMKQWKSLIEGEGNSIEVQNNIVYVNGNSSPEYTLRHDYYFVLGDNRSNSYDSRYWGYVRDIDLIGEPFMVYFSRSPDSTPVPSVFRFDRIGTLVH